MELREAGQEQCQGSMQELRATVVDLQQQLFLYITLLAFPTIKEHGE